MTKPFKYGSIFNEMNLLLQEQELTPIEKGGKKEDDRIHSSLKCTNPP